MQKLWFTSDSHWGHSRIIQYSNRPFDSVEQMDQALIDNWNAVVGQNDIVWHLGDFAFCRYDKIKWILGKLNGRKNLVLGNHDKEIVNNWDEILRLKLFESIQDYKVLRVDGQKIIMLHYGLRVWESSHHGSIMLYGHSHGSLPSYGRSVDVGVDCKEITAEYRPVELSEIMEFMKDRKPSFVDHHRED